MFKSKTPFLRARQAVHEMEKIPIPSHWRQVEIRKLQPKVDLAPYFRDWETCPNCNNGTIEVLNQRSGYAIKGRVPCPDCHGQGGWHMSKKEIGISDKKSA